MDKPETKTLLSWTAPEFIYYAKTRTWFVVLGIISAVLFIIFLLLENYIFAFLILIAALLTFVHAQKRPRQITIKITSEGINIGEYLSLTHKEIISFWIFKEPDLKSLHLETKKILQPKISVLLANQDPAAARESLIKFIPEKKHEEQLIDVIARKLKF